MSLRTPSPVPLAALAGAFAFAAAGSAAAQDVGVELGVASQYVGKGLGKSGGDPSVNGEVEVSTGQVYASVFASSAETSQGSHAEVITAVGWRPEFAGFAFDVQVMNRDLPGARDGVDENYWEYQADVSRKLGPVSTRLRVNYSPDGFAATREAWWVELQGGVALDGATRLTVAVADRSADGGAEYLAWNAGVKRKLTDRLAVDVRWYDTDSHVLGENYEGRLVGALSLSL